MRVISQQVCKFLPQTTDVLMFPNERSVTSGSSPERLLRLLWAGFVTAPLKYYRLKQKSHIENLARLFQFW